MSSLLIRLYRAVKPVLGQPLRTAAHGLRRTLYRDQSQLGESLIARSLVTKDAPRWVVEVGANDGVTGSNSYLFVRKGWRALLIEPNPRLFPALQAHADQFDGVEAVQAACSDKPGTMPLLIFEGDETGMLSTLHPNTTTSRDGALPIESATEVRVETLTTLLDAHNVPGDFGVLSVDTEGHDLNVLRGLDFDRFRPRIIITETDDDPAGEAAKRILLDRRGYHIAGETQINTIWTQR